MKATPPAQCSTVASLLAAERYSMCQIKAETSLWKSTIRRIGRELEVDKENHPRGYHAKLTLSNKQALGDLIQLSRPPILSTTLFPTLLSSDCLECAKEGDVSVCYKEESSYAQS